MSKSTTQDSMKIHGMFRVHIEEDGKIVGDSGWHENQITTYGFNNFIVSSLGSIAGSAYIGWAALGTGTAPATNAQYLPGENYTNGSSSVVRASVAAATSSTSKALALTATFNSTNSFVTSTGANISNIGLYNISGPTTAAGSLFAGNTYTSSALASNQNVNITYSVSFS
jgi:hypothetical protein